MEQRGGDIYEIDEALLEKLRPDLILTQELCKVCAVSYTKVKEAARILETDTKIVSLEPRLLEDIVDNILLVGEITGKRAKAEKVAAGLTERINKIKEKTRSVKVRPRVFFMEWLKPPWVGGHWIPQMVDFAGGIEGLGHLGEPSNRIEWERILEYKPEIIVLAPCGYEVDQVMKEAHVLSSYPRLETVPAFQSSKIFAVNASAYFSRPGPRVVDGLEILATIVHPEIFPKTMHWSDVRVLDPTLLAGTDSTQA